MKKILILILSVYGLTGLAQQKPDAALITNGNTVINAGPGQNTAAIIGGDFLDLAYSKLSVIPLSASGTNTYIAASAVVTSYSSGIFEIVFQNGNTGASTLNINQLGAINLQKLVSGSYTALASGDIQNNQKLEVWYDQPNNTFQVFIGGAWGTITGTLSNQTDLQNALNLKANNPMTAVGDLITGGTVTNGYAAPTRIGIGTNTYVLTSNGTTASWVAPVGLSGMTATRVEVAATATTLQDFSQLTFGFASPNSTLTVGNTSFIMNSSSGEQRWSMSNSYFPTIYSNSVEVMRASNNQHKSIMIGSTTENASLYVAQAGVASGWIPTFRIDPGTQTALTAATEFNHEVNSGATWTWIDGTTATQRFSYDKAFTLNKTTTSATFTNTYRRYIEASAAGAGVTLTNNYALGLSGSLALVTAGNYIAIKEGSNAFMGQVALVSGTKAISITGLTTSDRAIVTLVTPSGVTLTTTYQAVCTANTLTLQANVAAGTINTSDASTLNYIIFRPTP